MAQDQQYILEMRNISKSFPGVKALDRVNFKVRPGTVHSLMGENGAGKSTLMKCLFGIYKEEGEIFVSGKLKRFNSAKHALESGVSMIHQELSIVPERSVMENIWLGREPIQHLGPFRFINHKKMLKETHVLLKNLEMETNPKERMGALSISKQQACEIAKAISYDASIVVMDEPTSSLTEKEVDHLFKIIGALKDKGVAVIYISHRMSEIFKISDDISVMRDGKMVATHKAEELNDDKLIKLMVGRDMTHRFPPVESIPGKISLKVEDLSSPLKQSFQNISLHVRQGEILGIGGLVGAQRTEFVEAIFGLREIEKGKVFIDDKEVKIESPKDAISSGIGLITEDRRGSGIFPLLSIIDNTSISSLKNYKKKIGFLNHKDIKKESQKINEKLRTKTPHYETPIQNLSGGNQQKVIVSRWLMTLPEILIMDEPTRGIDVGAKYEIYLIMRELANAGKSIIMVSSEMSELMGMSHRIAVLCNGKLTGVLDKENANQEKIMRLATSFE